MRKRQTFLLTILSEENDKGSLCGRVKAISSGKTCNFTNLDELNELIVAEMVDNPYQPENEQEGTEFKFSTKHNPQSS